MLQLLTSKDNHVASVHSTVPVYSRPEPSIRYKELVKLYKIMHEEGYKTDPPDSVFTGRMLFGHVESIKQVIDNNNIKTVLDYGSGKGYLYDKDKHMRHESGKKYGDIAGYWGIDIRCYDPAYTPYSQLPAEKSDLVICTDVIEHCPEEDIEWILEEIFSYANKSVFISIACYPALKSLPNGENPHCLVRPARWWKIYLQKFVKKFPAITYYILLESLLPNSDVYANFVGGPPFTYSELGNTIQL